MTPVTDNPQASTPKPVRVLVAEDSPLNRQIALKQLEKLGYAADGVGDGTEALEALKRTSYGIILMDCQMPEVDAVIAGIGTGGTICGVGRYLKEKKPAAQVVAVDPKGSIVYDYFKTGKLETRPKTYKIEGIGEDFLPKNYDFSVIDAELEAAGRAGARPGNPAARSVWHHRRGCAGHRGKSRRRQQHEGKPSATDGGGIE